MRALLIAASLVAFATPASAASRFIDVSLYSEQGTPAAGSASKVALYFRPQPGWHVYWSNPGEAGIAPSVVWNAPAGVKIGSLQHPAPHALTTGTVTSFVHEGNVGLIAPLAVAASFKEGDRIPLTGSVRWVSCSAAMCVPEQADVQLTLTVGAKGQVASPSPLFSEILKSYPKPIKTGASYSHQGDRGEVRLPLSSYSTIGARLFPINKDFGSLSDQRISREGSDLVIRFKAPAGASHFDGVITNGAGINYTISAKAAAMLAPQAVPEHRTEYHAAAAATAASPRSAEVRPLPRSQSHLTSAMVQKSEPSSTFYWVTAAILLAAFAIPIAGRRLHLPTKPR